ncbi:MAG: ester cyclase [Vicinamibacterales bacterium]
MDHAVAIRRLYDLVNSGDIDGFGGLLADDFAEREELPGLPPTKAGTLDYFRLLRTAFPDLRMVPEDVIAAGDKAVARVRVSGTHQGPFMGMAATGRRVNVQIVDIIRFGDDGLAREHWGVVDQLAMMQQLGAIPAAPPA